MFSYFDCLLRGVYCFFFSGVDTYLVLSRIDPESITPTCESLVWPKRSTDAGGGPVNEEISDTQTLGGVVSKWRWLYSKWIQIVFLHCCIMLYLNLINLSLLISRVNGYFCIFMCIFLQLFQGWSWDKIPDSWLMTRDGPQTATASHLKLFEGDVLPEVSCSQKVAHCDTLNYSLAYVNIGLLSPPSNKQGL